KSGLFDAVFVTARRPRGMGGPERAKPAGEKREPVRPLNEAARQEFSGLANVTEVYPQIRIFADVKYDGATYSTTVLALPESAKNMGSFDGMTGKYFSSSSAEEAILQMEFAKELSAQPATLVGKELTVRYAQRQEKKSAEAGNEKDIDKEMDELMSGAIAIVNRETKLRIVGITESDPSAGVGGFGGGRV